MGEKKSVGPHQLWYEEETGFVCFVHNGTLNEHELEELGEFVNSCRARVPGEALFLLADDRKATGVSHDARKSIATSPSFHVGTTYVGIFGASFALRVVLNLFFKAIALSSSPSATMFAADDEAEARAWLAQQKRAYYAKLGGSASSSTQA
ncbi:MAG TPA: hypothetical protein VM580_28775 [Labilithrix sp.]|nr:hypothetical protein [Labilithrix sp.]